MHLGKECENTLSTDFRASNRTKIATKANNDPDSRLGVYMLVNPTLSSPTQSHGVLEFERVLLTRYRSGSHNLKIETGRWSRTPRENRLCVTCRELGDEEHVLYNCADIMRDDLTDIPRPLSSLWEYQGVNRLFKRIMDAEYV